ncbi:MAG: hypothetical protein ACK5OB_03520 [Pirellula sp.]
MRKWSVLLAIWIVGACCQVRTEAGVVAGSLTIQSRADQTIRLFPGTPLNPGVGAIDVPTSATGSFSFSWAAQNVGEDFATLTSFTASFQSAPTDPLGSYTLTAPAADGFAGRLKDIVESGGNLISATLEVDTTFQVVLAGLPPLFTIHNPVGPAEDKYARFTGAITPNTPFGTVFTSLGTTNVYVNLGGGPVVVAQSFDRTVSVVPEPTTGMIASVLAGVPIIGIWRRRRAQAAA